MIPGPLIAAIVAVADVSAVASLRVDIAIVGVADDKLRAELEDLARASYGSKSYATFAPVRRATDKGAGLLKMALTSKGYYANTVTPDIARDGDLITATFQVTEGPLFSITEYRIVYKDQQAEERPDGFSAMAIGVSGSPEGDELARLETAALTYLRNQGYPAAQSTGRRVDATFASATGVAIFEIVTGPKAVYGEMSFEGLDKVRRNYLRALRPFEQGETVSRATLDSYRKAISDTGLFREVTVEPQTPDEKGRSNILVTVAERKRRTLGGGVSFGTDVGVGATAFWEDRNFRGGGENIKAQTDVSAPRQEFGLTYEKPLPRLPGRWGVDTLFRNEDTDAFNAQTATIGGGIIQTLPQRHLELSAKIQYTVSSITDNLGAEEDFGSASFPLSVKFDNENDALNPTAGHRVQLRAEPFLGSTSFTRTDLSLASRLTFGAEDRWTLAGRARIGTAFGASAEDVPVTERFFAGGGGSVRGYGYQLAGPIDGTGDPIGGVSIAEVNLEARYSVTPTWQGAAFVDAGTAFNSSTDDIVDDVPIGAGLGVRYFTPVGPIRIDIATPFVRRKVIESVDGSTQTRFEDSPLQVYIALGQPF